MFQEETKLFQKTKCYRIGERNMSVQDKIEHILKNIHLLFSESAPYEEGSSKIIVEKQIVFELLEQLNLAIYEIMDQYEITKRKHEMAERRCERRGEEILQKASKHADDIYAASIMYTDDAINRICYIMEDANEAVQKIFRQINMDMESQRERVRRNQLELTSQLRDFADTEKYVKLIEGVNRQLEEEHRQQMEGKEAKRIQNEGRSYSTIKPEIKINQAYFEQTGKNQYIDESDSDEQEEEKSLAKITGKEFAETLRRRAARGRERDGEREKKLTEAAVETKNVLAVEENNIVNERESNMPMQDIEAIVEAIDSNILISEDLLREEEADISDGIPEIRVDLDAEYFKWKEGVGKTRVDAQEKKHFLFGRKS